jgi:hypothetical protein
LRRAALYLCARTRRGFLGVAASQQPLRARHGRVSGCAALASLRRAQDAHDIDGVVDALCAHAGVESVHAVGWLTVKDMLADGLDTDARHSALALAGALAALRAFMGNVDVADGATAVVAAMASVKQLRARVVGDGVCEAFAAAMRAHAGDAHVQAQACAGLQIVLAHTAGQQRATDAGVPGLVLEAMRTHRTDIYVQRAGCHVLALLATEGWLKKALTPVQAQSFATGAVEAVLAALRTHASHAKIQAAVMRALFDLLIFSEHMRDVARRSGAIEAAVLGLHSGVELHIENCCGVLMILVGESEHAMAGRAGIVEALLVVLPRRMPHDVTREACKQLARVLRVPENAARAVAAGAGEVVLAVLAAHIASEEVQTAGCSLLVTLANHCPNYCSLLGRAGACEAALAAMQAHPLHEPTHSYACEALHSIVPENCTTTCIPDCIAAIIAALKVHRNTALAMIEIATLVCLMSSSPGAHKRACEAGAVDVTVAAFVSAADHFDGGQDECLLQGVEVLEVLFTLPVGASNAHVEAVVAPAVKALRVHRHSTSAPGLLLSVFAFLLRSNAAAPAAAVRFGAMQDMSAFARVHKALPIVQRCCEEVMALLQSSASAAADAAMAALLAEEDAARAPPSSSSRKSEKKRAGGGGGGGSQAASDASEAHAAPADAPAAVAPAAVTDAVPPPAEQPAAPPAAAPAPRSAEAERRRRRAAAKAARRAADGGDAPASAAATDDAAGSSDAGGAGGDAADADADAPSHGAAISPPAAAA